MQVNDKIFKAYDVRGIDGQDLSEELYYLMGVGLTKLIESSEDIASPIVIGYDGRENSERYAQAITDALTDNGVEVLFIGRCTTPMVYFAINHLSAGGGAMITASHNPKEYNGLKISGKNAVPISPTGQGVAFTEYCTHTPISSLDIPEQPTGKARDISIVNDYIKFLMQSAKVVQPLKISADAGNGVASISFIPLVQSMDVELFPLHMDVDGSFPNHEANPSKLETLDEVAKSTIENECDFGIAFDGDADRVGFIDEKGNKISADIMACLVIDHMLKAHPGRHIVHELRCTRALSDVVEKHGASFERTKVGRPAVITGMRQNQSSIFGVERSGHFFFTNFFNMDNAMLMFLHVANIVSDSNKTLSELIKPYQTYFSMPEINVSIKDWSVTREKIKEAYKGFNLDELDGVSVRTEEMSFTVRPSNTEPLIRVTLEAINEDLANSTKDKLLGIVQE